MLKFLLGAAVGYVLGAKAGHRRYEQLKRTIPPSRGPRGSCGRASRRRCTAVTPADRHGREAPMLELVGIRRNSLLDVVGNH
jgi:hypothetical protein